MALTAARLDEFRRLLNGLSLAASADLRIALANVDMSDQRAVRDILHRFWPDLVLGYGQASSALGATLFEMMADDLAVSPTLRLAREGGEQQALARMRWAVKTDNPWGNLLVLLDELVKQPARDTIADSAFASRGGWARVPRGGETCAFCRLLASRGAVYTAEESATRVTGIPLGGADSITAGRKGRASIKRPIGEKYHGGCDCAVVFVRSPDDYPEGYDPQVYVDQYRDAPSTDIKEILAHMRQESHTH